MEITQVTPYIRNKRPWRRLVNPDTEIRPMANAQYYSIPTIEPDGLHYQYLGNAELLNESTEGARIINSNMCASRPIYELVTRKIQVDDGDGNMIEKEIKEEVVVGYDRIENVRSGLGEMIIVQKSSHLGKCGVETADELGKDHEAYDNWLAWKEISGVDAELPSLIYSAGKCGDAAIYIYQQGKTIRCTLFSFLFGDVLFDHKDNNGNPMRVRLYQLNGRQVVDFYMTDYIETYVQGDLSDLGEDNNLLQSWWATVKGWFRNIDFKKTEDGWTRISRSRSQLDDYTCQVAYLRFNDSFIGHAMQNIEAYDRALSYTSDKMRSTAFSKLLVKAPKIKNLPPLSSGEEVIGIDGDVESLKASDVKHVTPPDISNIATINLKNIFDAIMQSTMSIDLQPEILKSGADSSQTLKLLLRREIQWCHIMWPQLRPVNQEIVEILKGLVGKLEGDIERYGKLRISTWNTPWLPQDEDALAERINKYIYNGTMSAESGRHESGMRYTNDAKQIAKEQEEKIFRETYVKLKAEAQARKDFGIDETANDVVVDKVEENPSKDEASPKIDNNAPYKSMAENKVNK